MTHKEQPRGSSRTHTAVDLVRELARKLMKPELESYMTGGGYMPYMPKSSDLAYDSQHGEFGYPPFPTIQQFVSTLRSETVEESAEELLDALHRLFNVDAEFTIRILWAVASNERAKAMKHADHAATCNGLANTIAGKMPKPRELDQQKLDLLYAVCIEILSIPQTWTEPAEEGRITISEEHAAELRGLIQGRLGLKEEKDAHILLHTLRAACEGLWRVNIEHEIQSYLQQIVKSIQEHGRCNLGFGGGSATQDDLEWLDSHGGRALKPEKESEYRTVYVRASLLEGAEDPSKIFEAAFPYVHYTIRTEAIRLGFYAEENPQAQGQASGGSERDTAPPATNGDKSDCVSRWLDRPRRVLEQLGYPQREGGEDEVILRPKETRLPDVPAPKPRDERSGKS